MALGGGLKVAETQLTPTNRRRFDLDQRLSRIIVYRFALGHCVSH